jgi:branched-chain amino acid transport system ATP-binding protein
MLAVQDLEVSYQGIISAVRGVSLEVPDRGVVALLGANGAGKTTILRAIGGLLRLHGGRVTRGTIVFDGKRIDTLDATGIIRLGIAQVLEGRRLFADLSVEENLRTGAIAVRDAATVRRAHDRVMELFPVLRERRNEAAGYLSGGEQQMLAIGRGLMASPKLLLLDEPSLGLAPFMVQQIGRIISEISAGGTAVLLVEQNAQMALKHADAGYVLETGRVALQGPAADLLRDEEVRTFYLGLHEGEGHANFAALRQRRPDRRWAMSDTP